MDEPRLIHLLSLQKRSLIIFGCPMSHAQPQLLDLLLHAQLTRVPSVLLTSHRDNRDDLRQGAEFGRLDEQSLFTFLLRFGDGFPFS